MPAKLTEKERIKLIKRVILKGEPVSRVCQEAGISRVLFYRWLARYKEEGTVAPKKPRKVPSRQVPEKDVKKIIALVRAHPTWSTHKISKCVPVGNHGIQNVFSRLNLNTAEKREEFARKAKEKKKIAVSRAPQLSPKQRLEAIERVIKYKEPVAHVCADFHISRPNFYKWLKRYKAVPEDKKLEVLVGKKPKVERYYRQAPEKYEDAVLSVVASYPEFGVTKIVQALPVIAGKPIVGHHGVQNILRRHDLNTYEKRLVYAQAQVTPVTRLVSAFEGLGTRFVILPVETRARIIRFAGVALLTAFSTTLVLGVLGYFATITAAAPVPSRIGLFFATLALSVGSIFFAYSMKYYLTLAIVLSFSRQPLEEGTSTPLSVKGGYAVGLNGRLNNNQKNGNGWLARIFGLNGFLRGPTSLKSSTEVGPPQVTAGGLQPSLEHIKLKRYPFVSIHLPFYNEKKVAERILKACTSMDYPNLPDGKAGFEIIVCDDSTDETTAIVERFVERWNRTNRTDKTNRRGGPLVKVLHRPTRQGFKGGALAYALKHINPKTEFVVVFDADFIPYPDTLELFMKYFQANGLDLAKERFTSEVSQEKSNIACIAGYQWHVLNKSENWITRGVRTEYAGSYVIERPGQEILGAIKLIHGSVYAIRADVLRKFGWGTSITEDFELTLRLYEQGYKVIYTPYIQGPAECVSTLKRLIRQRMRWAEGHSNNIKRMFFRLIRSPKLTLPEKLEVLYLSPYYFQAFFFLVGTLSWLMAETVFRARLPFWTSLWGWSLVLTNFFSLPLMNAVGLFLEESEEKDYLGILSFVALSYILVPFQAYASVKGFLEKEEGPWFRTPKTGLITDIFTRGRFYRWISGILPGRRPEPALARSFHRSRSPFGHLGGGTLPNPYLALATANNQFNGFKIKPKRLRWVSKVILGVLLIFSVTISSMTKGVSITEASQYESFYLTNDESVPLSAEDFAWQLLSTGPDTKDTTTTVSVPNETAYKQFLPGLNNTTTGTPCGSSPNGQGWIFDTPFDVGGTIASGTWTFYVVGSATGQQPTCNVEVCIYKITVSGGLLNTSNLLYDSTGDATWQASQADVCDKAGVEVNDTLTTASQGTFNFNANEYLYVEYWLQYVGSGAGTFTATFITGNTTDPDPAIDMPTMTIPENAVFLVATAPFIPMIVLWLRQRRGIRVVKGK